MMDVAKGQGKTINDSLLSERLGIPVLPFTAADGKEYDKLKTLIEKELKNPHRLRTKPAASKESADANEKFAWIGTLLDGVTNAGSSEYELSNRVAYQFDGVLSKLGLQGKAVAPILSGIVYHVSALFI